MCRVPSVLCMCVCVVDRILLRPRCTCGGLLSVSPVIVGVMGILGSGVWTLISVPYRFKSDNLG